MPFAIPPMPCSRTPKRRLRPGSSALKFGSPLTSVRFDSDRSAAPPNSSGTGPASAWIASCDAFRVAISSPTAYVLRLGVPPGPKPARRRAAGTPPRAPRRARRTRASRLVPLGDEPLAGRDRLAEDRQRLGRHVEGLVRDPSRRPPWSGGPRRDRAARRAPSASPACSGCRSRCGSGPRSGSAGRRRRGPSRSPTRWRRRRCRRRPAGCASRRRRSASGRPPTSAIAVGPSSWMPLSSYRTISLPRRRWPARLEPPPRRCPPGGRRHWR